jgi:hypothetical protein
MDDETITTTGIAVHGASRLPSVDIDSFNIELKDEEGFLGDRASKNGFRDILERWRKPLRKSGEDPFGKEPSENISKKVLDAILIGDDTEASAVVHSAIEDCAQELAHVTRRFLKTKAREKPTASWRAPAFATAGLANSPSRAPKSSSHPKISRSRCYRSVTTPTTQA